MTTYQNPPSITPADIAEMIRHWLSTPPNGYIGSPYGCDSKRLLQRPQGDSSAVNEFLAKMRADLPILSALPAGAVNVYVVDVDIDKREIRVDVAGQMIQVGAPS